MGHLKYCLGILMELIPVERSCAYIDPGVGSTIFQLIIAIFFGGIFVVKMYWKRMNSLLLKLFSRRKNSKNGNNE